MYLNIKNEDITFKFSKKFLKKAKGVNLREGYHIHKKQADLMLPASIRIASDYWSQIIEKNGIKIYVDMLSTLYETKFEYLLNTNSTVKQKRDGTYYCEVSDKWYLFIKNENEGE